MEEQLVAKLVESNIEIISHKRISIRAKGWDLPAIFIVVVFFFLMASLRFHRQSNLHLPFLPQRAPALLSNNLFH